MEIYRESENLILRPLCVTDFLSVYKNIRDADVRKWTSEPQKEILGKIKIFNILIKILGYFKKALLVAVKSILRIKEDKVYRFAIRVKDTAYSTIGIISLTRLDDTSADIGFWIGKKYWNKGYVSKAVELAVGISFSQLNIVTLKAWTYGDNIGSRKVLEKNNFELVGIEKNKYMLYGKLHDRYNYELSSEKVI